MSKTQPLLNFYSTVLESLNIVDVADGRLSLKVPNEDGEYSETPCLINGDRVVLPVPQILRGGTLEGMIAFHPLSENMLRGESDIIKFLRKMIKFRLSCVTSQLLIELMSIAADPEMHEDLSPRQGEYLQYVPHANDKTVKALSKLLQTHFDDILNIYLKRPDARDAGNFRRLAVVSFPIWDELNSLGSKVYDIDCGSVKNKKTIASLFEYVFPEPADIETWSEGSDNGTAPYFDALLRCYLNIGRRVAKLVYKYRKYLDHPDLQRGNLDWEEDMDNLDSWKTLIRALPGNKGPLQKGEKEPAEPKAHGFTPNYGNAAQQTHTHAPEATTVPPWEHSPGPAPQVNPGGYPAQETAPAVSEGGKHNWRGVMQSRPQTAQVPTYAGGQPVQSHTRFQMPNQQPQQQQQWGHQQPQQQQQWGRPQQSWSQGDGTSL